MISERREFASPNRKSANALKLLGEPDGPSAVRPPLNDVKESEVAEIRAVMQLFAEAVDPAEAKVAG